MLGWEENWVLLVNLSEYWREDTHSLFGADIDIVKICVVGFECGLHEYGGVSEMWRGISSVEIDRGRGLVPLI